MTNPEASGHDHTGGLSHEQLALLLEVSRALSSSIHLNVVLRTSIESVVSAMDFDNGAIYLPSQEGLALGALWPAVDDFPDELSHLRLSEHWLMSRSVEERAPVFVEDLAATDLSPAERAAVEFGDLRSALYVPLIAEDDYVGSFVICTSGRERRLTQSEIDLCMTMAFMIAMAVENARLFDSVREANVRLSQAYEDVLERKAQLRALASQLTKTEERQRRKLAVELHDRVTQPLALLKMKIFLNEEQWPAHHEHPEYRDAIHLLDEALDQTRSITSEMSPPYVFELGLRPALDWLCARTSAKGLACAALCEDSVDEVGEETRLLVFQAARELLANVVKHAFARTATISCWRENEDVVLQVVDDGRGFDADRKGIRSDEDHGFGLFSLTERLTHAGGSLDIVSTLGLGTTATARLPLRTLV